MKYFLPLLIPFIFLSSCETTESVGNDEVTDESMSETPKEDRSDLETAISLLPMNPSPAAENAGLTIMKPQEGEDLSPGTVSFEYEVSGFQLQKKSMRSDTIDIAESEKGQHIHAILNNEPYMAYYEPGFKKDLEPGRYVLLSFLSRSHHESLKEETAFDLIQFTVGNSGMPGLDTDAPHLFYSRPKGTYDIAAHPDILLDFYLVNCTLDPEGYRVKATIDGEEFTIDEWKPQIIRGLGEGMHTIGLELVDSEGRTVPSPFNPVEREIELVRGGS